MLPFLTLLGFAAAMAAPTPLPPPPVEGLPPHLSVMCTVRDWEGQGIKHYPGKLCHFFPDGRLLAATDDYLTLYSKDMGQLWRAPHTLHHMMTLTPDENYLYGLGSEIALIDGKRNRYDTVLKIDMKTGAELARFSTREHIDQLKKFSPNGHKTWKQAPNYWWKPDYDIEHTHGNTVFVIPKSTRTEPAYREGNILLNMNQIGLMVYLDSELKKILKIYHRTGKFQQHDLQLLPNGNILSYVNLNRHFSRIFSTLEEWDPETGEVKWQFKEKPSSNFYSHVSGGLQLLPGNLVLFSDTTKFGKYILIRRDGERVWMRPSGWTNPQTKLPGPVQTVKAVDLTEFMKNNKGG